jgi:hypothetical protein
MAQAGFTPISLYFSTTASAVPSSGNLVAGELALNTLDEKLYFKNSAGTVKLLASSAAVAPVTTISFGSTGLTPNTATSGAVTVAGTLAITNGGTGQTSASAAFNALSPITTTGDLIIGNGTNSATRLGIGGNGTVLQSNGTTASWVSFTSGSSLSNDTTTASDLFPMFANATSGTPTTVFTSNAKLLYKPSTGEFQASELVASNGIFVNNTTVSASYTVASGFNAMSVGPVTVASGQSVTVTSGQRWVVL